MEIGRFYCVLVINCVLLFSTCNGKPFSINEALAAEAAANKNKSTDPVTSTSFKRLAEKPAFLFNENPKTTKSLLKKRSKSTDSSEHSTLTGGKQTAIESLLKPLKNRGIHLRKLKELLNTRGKKLTPLKYRKLFQIDLPLKPKSLRLYNPRLKRRNQSVKRETSHNGKFDPKYIPLLRSFSMLIDDIIASDSREIRHHRDDVQSNGDEDVVYNDTISDLAKKEKATLATSSNSNQVSYQPTTPLTAPAATTDPTPSSDLFDLGQNKNIPLLFTRNPARGRRNNPRFSERGRATRHRGAERHLTGDHGDSQPGTGCKRNTSSSTDNEDPCGAARVGTSGNGAPERIPRNGISTGSTTVEAETTKATEASETTTDTVGKDRGDFKKPEIENQHEAFGNETEPSQHFRRRLRGSVSENQVSDSEESLQSFEAGEKGNYSLAKHIPGDQRLVGGVRAFPRKNKTIGEENEGVISLSQTDPLLQNLTMNKSFVIIIDGYSVTRGMNGKNIISEKSIRVHS